jgi:predicted lipid-binding transport protein (Tim44 family)
MEIDPRGPRFGALVTLVVFVVVLITGSVWLLAAQAVVFGVGAVRGIHATPYAWLFRRFVRPRLAPPAELEDARPPRFAQGVGLGFAVVGVLGGLAGLTPVFLVATGLALAAAFLNAAFGYCLGCEVYLLIRRFTRTREEIPA